MAPDGRRIEVPVEVIEKTGRKLDKLQHLGQVVTFCDLGIVPVTVVVGIKGCNQVHVDDVPVRWNEPYNLKVTYDAHPCTADLPRPVPYCQVLLRVKDAQGNWLEGAGVRFDSAPPQEILTDNAGRVFSVVKLKGTLGGTVNAPGFAAKAFSITCSETENHEEILELASGAPSSH